MGIIMLIVSLIAIFFWIRTLLVMSKDSFLWVIGGFFVAPIAQIVFYLTKKDELEYSEDYAMMSFFYLQIGIIILTILRLAL